MFGLLDVYQQTIGDTIMSDTTLKDYFFTKHQNPRASLNLSLDEKRAFSNFLADRYIESNGKSEERPVNELYIEFILHKARKRLDRLDVANTVLSKVRAQLASA